MCLDTIPTWHALRNLIATFKYRGYAESDLEAHKLSKVLVGISLLLSST